MMKKMLLTAILLTGWLCSEIALAQAPDTLFISTSQVVHLRFASELKYVNLGSRDIVAKIVDGSKDFVAVKAREPFEGCTSLSCLEANGAMHSFVVAYREEPERLVWDVREVNPGVARGYEGGISGGSQGVWIDKLLSIKQEIFHIGASAYGIEVLCENLLVREDVLYLVVSVRNRSAVSYEVSEPRFAIESVRRSRRGLQVEKSVFPKQVYGLGAVSPGGYARMAFAFEKLALVKGQLLRVYWYEKGGARNLVMEVGRKDVEGVRRL